MKTIVSATAQSRLSPATLFDLLADPRGCVTWHDHPLKDRPQSTDAPPGPALAGAEYWSRGLCGTIAWRARTSVTAAERSRHYATNLRLRLARADVYRLVANRLVVARSLRKNFHHVLKAAEAEAARSAST